MADLNNLSRPVTTDTEPDVLDTLRAHIVRAATGAGWGGTVNKVAGLVSATTAAVSGGRALRLFRRNDDNTAEEEVVSLPGVSVGGSAATAGAVPWAGVTSKPPLFGDADSTWYYSSSDVGRLAGTWYQNTSGKVLCVFFNNAASFQIKPTLTGVSQLQLAGGVSGGIPTTLLVPHGWYYRINSWTGFWWEIS